jgi:hypothetical protein
MYFKQILNELCGCASYLNQAAIGSCTKIWYENAIKE